VTLENATFNVGFAVLWVAIAAVFYGRKRHGPMWKLVLAYLVAQGTWAYQYTGTDLGWTLSELLGPLNAAILLHLVLAFPTGRLADRTDRILVALAYTITVPLQLLAFLFFDPAWVGCGPQDWCPQNVLLIVRNDAIVELVRPLGLASPVIALAVIAELARHWLRASSAARRALAPVVIGMPLVFLVLGIWWAAPALDRDDIRVFLLQNKLFDLPSYLTPVLFLAGVLLTRLSRASIVELAVELAHGVPVGRLRESLARALRDPSLELAFPAPDGDGFVDQAGRRMRLPDEDARRTVARLERDGSLLGVLIHDPSVGREDPGLVEAVGTVAGLALENERLAAQLRAQLDEVRASRARIVAAADDERRRAERDLHDGAQQRLVALALRLETARLTNDSLHEILDEASAELQAAVDEVRALSRGTPRVAEADAIQGSG
jgi:signal transduction histidine kinase